MKHILTETVDYLSLSPAITKILAQGLQRYNSPADWARKLFKTSTDSASRASWDWKKKFFRFGFVVLWGRMSQVGCHFHFWPSLGLVYAALDANLVSQLFRSSFCFRN